MQRSRMGACLGAIIGLVFAVPAVAEQMFLFFFGFGPTCS